MKTGRNYKFWFCTGKNRTFRASVLLYCNPVCTGFCKKEKIKKKDDRTVITGARKRNGLLLSSPDIEEEM